MNQMELVPTNANDFSLTRRLEQLGRCAHFEASLRQCRAAQQEVRAATLLPEVRAERLAYIAALIQKLQQLQQENPLCYPFSLN